MKVQSMLLPVPLEISSAEEGCGRSEPSDQLSCQIPWLRVFVEGVVIVGSILLAFGIDAWWDAGGPNSTAVNVDD